MVVVLLGGTCDWERSETITARHREDESPPRIPTFILYPPLFLVAGLWTITPLISTCDSSAALPRRVACDPGEQWNSLGVRRERGSPPGLCEVYVTLSVSSVSTSGSESLAVPLETSGCVFEKPAQHSRTLPPHIICFRLSFPLISKGSNCEDSNFPFRSQNWSKR